MTDRTAGPGGPQSPDADALLSRRRLLKIAGIALPVLGAPGLLAACKGSEDDSGGGTVAAGGGGGGERAGTIKIGYVTPQTGPLAGFGEADAFVTGTAKDLFKDGLSSGGRTYGVDLLVKDSQSDSNRASAVAGDLILRDEVDLVLVASTPETVNPVASQCEANGVPCVSTLAPWQPYFFGRNGDPAQGFSWTYHFFWGLEDIIAVFGDMWNQVGNNKVVAALWPNDGDGNAWGDGARGFPPPLKQAGYQVVDPGRYTNLSEDFSAQISQFKAANAEIVTGVPLPPDFTTFWKQASQQGFRPKVASVGKALLFPSAVEALGGLGEGLSSEVWWSPRHPFKSSLTGQSAQALADAYTSATGKQWTQPIGFVHALLEVAADVFKRAANPKDKRAVVEAIKGTEIDTIVGPVSWRAKGPAPNVTKTPLVGGQWVKGTDHPYELTIVSNGLAPEIPTAGKLAPLGGA